VPFIATVLREQGILSGSAPVSNADAWLARFENHLMRVHGLALESQRLVGYLTRDEMEAVLTAPDQSTWIGRRDYALLLTMYNSGARLSEMTRMQPGQKPGVFFETGSENVKSRQRRWHFLQCAGRLSRAMA
jgi:integrase